MLNYLKKFTMEILPSVAATIIGAYIVNHYINAKPGRAPAAAAVSTASPKAGQAAASPSRRPRPPPSRGRRQGQGYLREAPCSRTARPRSRRSKSRREAGRDREPPAETRDMQPPCRVKRRRQVFALAPAVTPAAANSAPAEAAVAPESAAMPTISRAPRSSACAARGKARREAARKPRVPPESAADRKRRARRDPASAPRPACARCRRRSWFRRRRPSARCRRLSREAALHGAARTDDPSRPTPPAEIPAVAPPLDLRAEAARAARANAQRVAEDMLTGRRRCSTRCCRSSATPALPSSVAAFAR